MDYYYYGRRQQGLGSLQQGSSGERVKELQRRLNSMGVASPPLVVDGIFGPKTAAAVAALHSLFGLPAVGVVDDALERSLFGSASPPRSPAPTTPGVPPGVPPGTPPKKKDFFEKLKEQTGLGPLELGLLAVVIAVAFRE